VSPNGRTPAAKTAGATEEFVATKRRSLNLEIIASNLAEAVEELDRLRSRASNGDSDEAEWQVGLCHA
jgi:hypothetical protein